MDWGEYLDKHNSALLTAISSYAATRLTPISVQKPDRPYFARIKRWERFSR